MSAILNFSWCILFSFSVCADPISYSLIAEQFDRPVVEGGENSNFDDKAENRMLQEDFATGFVIDDGGVFALVGDNKYNKIGCASSNDTVDGYYLIIDSILKIFIPKDFSFENQMGWSWENYEYSSVVKRKYHLLGNSLNIVEVSAKCVDCIFDKMWFEYDLELGVVSITLSSDDGFLVYFMNGFRGFPYKWSEK